VFAERRATLESSVGYLDTLARNYAKLTPRVDLGGRGIIKKKTEIAASASVATNIRIRTRLADNVPRALGDAVVVRRIIDNLVRNAVESFNADGGEVTLSTARAPDGGVRIVVADTGSGMTKEELDHAFDDFFTTKADGTGLGLSVVRRLTTDLNGSVRVESAPGQGTAFTIELPACTPS
jgi:signal transduction histidine kinase